MKAVVMAGGEGTRLRPLTSNQPKPMVPVLNKPCAQHILELVRRHGIEEVIMTLAFLPKHIRSYFGDGSSLGLNVDYTVEEVPAGTAGSVFLAKDLLKDTFIVISGDALTDFDLTSLIDFHRERDALVTIALKSVPNPLEFGVVIVDEQGRIQRFLEKPGWGQVFSDTVNTGIYVMEPEVLERIPSGKPFDFSRELFPRLFEDKERLYGRICEGYWQDIGSLDQYLQANRDALDGKVRLTPPGVRLRGNIWVAQGAEIEALDDIKGPAVIGEDVRIEPGAQVLGHAVIGDHSVLRAGCRVTSSVLGENVYMASRAVAAGAIIGDGVELRENAHVSQGAIVGDRSRIGRGAVVASNVKIYPFKSVEPGSVVRSSLVWETRGSSSLFGKNGVRGLANVDLSPEVALRLAMSYATMLPNGATVTASRDRQGFSRVVHAAMISALNAAGVDVRDLEVATPAVNRSDLRAGHAVGSIHVQMTADSSDHMEILFSEAPGVPIDSQRERSIENHYFREDFRRAPYDHMGEVVHPPGVLDAYTSLLLENWDTRAIRDRRPRVVLEIASPSSAQFVPAILERVGTEVVALTKPLVGAVTSVGEEDTSATDRVGEVIRAVEADLGFVLDPGGERLLLLDEGGRPIQHSALLLTLAKSAAARAGEGTVSVPLHATRWVEKLLESTAVTVRRTKCSDNALLADSLQPNTIFAANTDGGYAFPQFLPSMDAVYAMGRVLELLAADERPLSHVLGDVPKTHVVQLTQDCPWQLKGAAMRALTSLLADGRVSLVDGVKVFLEKGDWVLVLPDTEEPFFHIYCEATSDRRAALLAAQYVEKLQDAIALAQEQA